MAVQHTRLFLEGRNDELVERLRRDMAEASGEERFERAAQLRDAIRVIETLRQRQQKMTGTELGDRDAFGLKVGPAGAVVEVFQVRGGKVLERSELVIAGVLISSFARNTSQSGASGAGSTVPLRNRRSQLPSSVVEGDCCGERGPGRCGA